MGIGNLTTYSGSQNLKLLNALSHGGTLMADFCKQCSIEIFDQDFNDLAGITKPEDQAKGLFAVVICEGCGLIQVDAEGKCISSNCLKKHGE